MTASDLQAEIMLALSKGDTRVFRTNAGQAWAGKIVRRTAHSITLSPAYPIRLGPIGYSDLNGFSPLIVRPEDVGVRVAVATSIEVKWGRDRVRPEQAAFIELVLASGGRAGIARSIEDARAIVEMPIKSAPMKGR